MNDLPYNTILEKIKSEGEIEIEKIILNQIESFYIDFKEVVDYQTTQKLSESDRKNLAKAVSGFSNTSGGLIIWGVKESGGKATKTPFKNPKKFAELLNDAVPSLTQPVQQGVESFVVLSIEDSELGYVISVIPKYYLSPVQIIAKIKDLQFKYYIRSGSSFSPANHDLLSGLYNRQRSSELVYLWQGTEHNSVEENEQILSYQFNFVLQNKGLAILRDIWTNFSSSGFTVDLLHTNDSQSFDIWNAFGKAANFISKDGFKRGPQGFISPFGLQIKLTKNNLPENPWIYISYGSDQVAPTELKSIPLTREDLEKFIKNPDKSIDRFLELLGLFSSRFE